MEKSFQDEIDVSVTVQYDGDGVLVVRIKKGRYVTKFTCEKYF